MIYCDNNFKKIIKAFIRALRVFFSSFVSKCFIITIILLLVHLLLFINENHVEATSIVYDASVSDEIKNYELFRQNDLILTLYYPFIENTNVWVNTLKPMLDNIKNANCDIYVTMNKTSSVVKYNIFTYYGNNPNSEFVGDWSSSINGSQYFNITFKKYTAAGYHIDFYPNSNIFNVSIINPTTFDIPKACVFLRSDMWSHFMELVYGGSSGSGPNYSIILDDIKDYLDSIDTYNSLNNNLLNTISQILNTIANKTENDYTDQISGINNQVTDINNSIQTQTQQQHQDAQATQNAINNQTQQQHQDAQATQNIIQESTNSILSTEADDITMEDFGVSSPTIEGSPDLTNIFNLIYNSFMSVYEDDIYRIQFKLPSGDTTYNFDIPANALRDKLPEGLIVLISVFWWVILGGAVISFIVKIIHQVVTYSNGSVGGSGGGFLSELTMTPTEFVLFNILH